MLYALKHGEMKNSEVINCYPASVQSIMIIKHHLL